MVVGACVEAGGDAVCFAVFDWATEEDFDCNEIPTLEVAGWKESTEPSPAAVAAITIG